MRLNRLFLAAVIFTAAGTVAHASPTSLNRTLRLGDRGSDVLLLQQILNRFLEAPVAMRGPGSVGNETDYFGKQTASAVVRFQEKYRSEILAPAGFSRGTGVVGSLTRAKLITMLPALQPIPVTAPVGPVASPVIPSQGPITIDGPVMGAPKIISLSPSSGGEGTVMTITGSGFEQTGNTIYTGYAELTNVPSPDGKTIAVTINPGFHKSGTAGHELPFWIYVISGRGKSNPMIFTYQIASY